ncbi:unnamed protein product, partial [Amoebophrya sp. A25]
VGKTSKVVVNDCLSSIKYIIVIIIILCPVGAIASSCRTLPNLTTLEISTRDLLLDKSCVTKNINIK